MQLRLNRERHRRGEPFDRAHCADLVTFVKWAVNNEYEDDADLFVRATTAIDVLNPSCKAAASLAPDTLLMTRFQLAVREARQEQERKKQKQEWVRQGQEQIGQERLKRKQQKAQEYRRRRQLEAEKTRQKARELQQRERDRLCLDERKKQRLERKRKRDAARKDMAIRQKRQMRQRQQAIEELKQRRRLSPERQEKLDSELASIVTAFRKGCIPDRAYLMMERPHLNGRWCVKRPTLAVYSQRVQWTCPEGPIDVDQIYIEPRPFDKPDDFEQGITDLEDEFSVPPLARIRRRARIAQAVQRLERKV
jgi:hypothetical protein